jgi:DNA replication protein DnaC
MSAQFQPYLESIRAAYAKWWQLYTLTDAAGKQRQAKEVAPTFDFGLMVQTVKKETREPRDEDKIERFEVLKGIRKYAREFNHVLLVGRPGSGKSTALARLMLELAQEMLPEATSSDQPTVLDLVTVNRTLTAFERQRLEKRRQNLQTGWNQQSEKLARLRKALAIETQAADKFKLESQIKTEEAAIQDLEEQLSGIEQALSSGTIATLQTNCDGQIPVLVELRAWQTSMLNLIRSACRRHELCLSIAQIETMLDDRQFILLIDGVNELLSEAARTDIYNFQRDYPKVPMIFTTRDLSLGGDLGIEKKLEMQPLTEAQMQAFIRSYVPEQAEQMLRQLNDRLREFGQTPLLLWMLCEVIQQSPDSALPKNLGSIFKQFTETYEQSSVRKHEVAALKGDTKPLSDRRVWKQALKALAMLMMQGETPVDLRVVIHRDEAERELSRIFPNERFPIRDILDDLLKYYLLQNRSTDQIEFRHQLIQEYYAAEVLLEQLPKLGDESLKQEFLNFLKWTEPVALMLALVDEVQAVRIVKLALVVDPGLGSRLAGEVQPKFQQKTVEFVKALESPDWLKAQFLGVTRSHNAIAALLQLVQHPDFFVHKNAAEALGNIGSETAIPTLLQLAKHSDSFVCRNAASALGNIGSETAISTLLQLVQDSDFHVRESAASALGNIGSETAIPALLQLVQDSDSDVRWNAAEALGNIAEGYTDKIAPHLPYLLTLIPTDLGQNVHQVILAIQENCKYYNYEVFQAHLEAHKVDRQKSQNSDRPTTTNNFPNATEVKIFENVDRYHEAPPSSQDLPL